MIWIPNPMLQGPSNLPSELIFACECQLDKQVGRVGGSGGSEGREGADHEKLLIEDMFTVMKADVTYFDN